MLANDEVGNAKFGNDIRLYECKNCVVHAADESKVVVQDLDGYIVAEKNGPQSRYLATLPKKASASLQRVSIASSGKTKKREALCIKNAATD